MVAMIVVQLWLRSVS